VKIALVPYRTIVITLLYKMVTLICINLPRSPTVMIVIKSYLLAFSAGRRTEGVVEETPAQMAMTCGYD
jgi:hypothetical protein